MNKIYLHFIGKICLIGIYLNVQKQFQFDLSAVFDPVAGIGLVSFPENIWVRNRCQDRYEFRISSGAGLCSGSVPGSV